MPQEFKPGCARPTGGVVGEREKEKTAHNDQPTKEEEETMLLIGRRAQDFTTPAPSGWKPGKMALRPPGPALVGNVWKVRETNMAFD